MWPTLFLCLLLLQKLINCENRPTTEKTTANPQNHPQIPKNLEHQRTTLTPISNSIYEPLRTSEQKISASFIDYILQYGKFTQTSPPQFHQFATKYLISGPGELESTKIRQNNSYFKITSDGNSLLHLILSSLKPANSTLTINCTKFNKNSNIRILASNLGG
jgi:hypothetical protein